MMHKDLLALIVEDWYDIALRMKNDPKANKAFGWILEMFAFSIAASQAPDGPLKFELHGERACGVARSPHYVTLRSCCS